MTNGDTAKVATGVATDSSSGADVDPTKNVLDLVEAAIKRIDDLDDERQRTLDAQLRRHDDIRDTRFTCIRQEMSLDRQHARDMDHIRADYEQKLRVKETERIDAIRAVDVMAVQRAAEVSTAQQQTLATTVQVSAETLRTQVATTAVQQAASLAAALEPIQKDISELRKTQYEQQGQKAQQIENRASTVQDRGSSQWVIGIIVTVVIVLVTTTITVALALVFR